MEHPQNSSQLIHFGGAPMTRKLYEIAADIVEAQASFAQMSPDSLEQVLSRVFVTPQPMKMAEDAGFLLDQAKLRSDLINCHAVCKHQNHQRRCLR
jgi:hypothetical protein